MKLPGKAWFEARNYPPRIRVAIISSIALAFGVLCFIAGSRYYEKAMIQKREQQSVLKEVGAELENLQQEKVNLELADSVNRATLEQLRAELLSLEQKLATQNEELALFRTLTRDSVDMDELSVDSLTLRSTPEPNTYLYRIVVRGNSPKNDAIDASVSLTIEGERDGEPYGLPFDEADLSLQGKGIAVRFKYFKVLRGSLILPANFTPAKVVLSVIEKGNASSLRITEFPWVLEGREAALTAPAVN